MNESALVVTGDIKGFTKISPAEREQLIHALPDLFQSWVEESEHARIFRGDSFQLLFKHPSEGLCRTLQLRCWFKKNTITDDIMLDARMALGIGKISYYGDTVLDSDGEAFHISGRAFDDMEEGEFIKIMTTDPLMNEQFNIICRLMDVIISGWTRSQAEVIFLALENKTQQQMADELNVVQSAINNRLKLAKWKEIERTIHYISNLLER